MMPRDTNKEASRNLATWISCRLFSLWFRFVSFLGRNLKLWKINLDHMVGPSLLAFFNISRMRWPWLISSMAMMTSTYISLIRLNLNIYVHWKQNNTNLIFNIHEFILHTNQIKLINMSWCIYIYILILIQFIILI